MESRKLISFGNSSIVVTLPSAWVKKNRLKKGNEVYFHEEEGALRITKKDTEKKDLRFITIAAEDKPIEKVKIEIISAYVGNFDVIEIIDRKKAHLAKVKEILNNLSGVEIIEETASKIVVKYLIDIKELSIEGLIRRMDVVIRSMIEDMLLCFKEDLHRSIYERDENVNRLSLLAQRTIRHSFENPETARQFKITSIGLLNSSDAITNLEKIADQVKRISKITSSLSVSKKTKIEVSKILLRLKERYFKVMKAYYSENKELAYEIELETKELIAECNRLLSKKYETEAIRIAEHCKSFVANTKLIGRIIVDRG